MYGAAKFIIKKSYVQADARYLFDWGYNEYGQLGQGDTLYGVLKSRSSPTQVGSNIDWTFLAGGLYCSFGIRQGKLYSWGDNTRGQLGQGDIVDRSSPTQIGADTDWTKVAVGEGRSAYGIRGGKLYSWGYNLSGELGYGTSDSSAHYSPVQVGAQTDWEDISAGQFFALGIRGGKLYSWGINNFGGLGLGDTTSRSSPVQIGSATDWIAIEAGITEYALGIRSSGTLYAWGRNDRGQLAQGDIIDRSSPVQVGSSTGWTNVVGGNLHVLALNGGNLYTWGYNLNGELGDGTIVYKSSPVQIGSENNWTAIDAGQDHSVGIRGGYLYTWGINNFGQIGDGTVGSGTSKSSPVLIGSSSNWTLIAAGDKHTLALKIP